MDEWSPSGNETDSDIPLSLTFKRKKKLASKRRKTTPVPVNLEAAAADQSTIETSSDIVVSKFDFSVENHFKAVDKITEVCRNPETLDTDAEEIQRLSNSITFLKEWRDFNYASRALKFSCQLNFKEKSTDGEITLPQFSSAAVPKTVTQNTSKVTCTESSKDFVMNVGGSIWAFDWCPRKNSENCIKCEFVAVAAHPPESSYHKIGAPLIGRGAIQIWCVLTVSTKEDVSSHWNKKQRQNSQKSAVVKLKDPTKPVRPKGRPRKNPIKEDSVKRPKGRPRKNPIKDSVNNLHSDSESENIGGHVGIEDSGERCNDSNQTEDADMLLAASRGIGCKSNGRKRDQVHSNGESMMSDSNIVSISSSDSKTSNNFIPKDVALPRMMLCLAHNGKVAWDVKW